MLSLHNFHHEIRNRLNNGATIVVLDHAQTRMEQRRVTTDDIWKLFTKDEQPEEPVGMNTIAEHCAGSAIIGQEMRFL